MKKIIAVILCVAAVFSFAGCAEKAAKDENKVQIVTTIFPLYDFARQVGGDKVQVTLLLPTGAEAHSYEPTPKDVIEIKESDIFIAQGGDADPWTSAVINDADSKELNVLYSLECVTLMSEEHEHPSFSSHVHTDPHVWTTPKNAGIIRITFFGKMNISWLLPSNGISIRMVQQVICSSRCWRRRSPGTTRAPARSGS